MTRLGLLPASGLATRMRGLPKFLLPIQDGPVTLLERQVLQMLEACDLVLVATSERNKHLVDSLHLGDLGAVRVLDVAGKTMAETVHLSLSEYSFRSCLLGMPDTYFGSNPYLGLSQSNANLSAAVWNSRPEQIGKLGSVAILAGEIVDVIDKDPKGRYAQHWGALSFSKELAQSIDPSWDTVGELLLRNINRQHIPAVEVYGDYFDCGTFSEYKDALRTSETESMSRTL